MLLWIALHACDETPDAQASVDLAALSDACEAALGPWPEVTCEDGVEVLVSVTTPDGTTRVATGPDDLEDGVACDRPSIISGCVTGSRAGSVRTPQAVYHFVCRRNDFDTPLGQYDDVAMIGHDPASGAACFWGADDDGTRRDGRLPRPAGPDDHGYWATVPELAALRCRDCHDADPIVVTPWIEATGVIDNDPMAPFELIGQQTLQALESGWTGGRRVVHPDASACTDCHDLTDGFSCRLAAEATGAPVHRATVWASTYPNNTWMDRFDGADLASRFPTEADWSATFGLARATLEACCAGDLPDEDCYGPQ